MEPHLGLIVMVMGRNYRVCGLIDDGRVIGEGIELNNRRLVWLTEFVNNKKSRNGKYERYIFCFRQILLEKNLAYYVSANGKHAVEE